MRNEVRQCGCETATFRANLHDVPQEAEMVHVFDPVNKAPYKLTFAGTAALRRGDHSEVCPTVGLRTYFHARASGANKRFFLCKQFQNNRCRAHENCNSIHACREQVAALRAANPRSREAIESDTLIPVTYTHSGGEERFTVPMDKTEQTVARDQIIQHSLEVSAPLCTDYEHGRCAAGALCTRVHVEGNHLKQLRQLWKSPCCTAHHGADAAPGDHAPEAPALPAGLRGFCVVASAARGRDWDATLLGATRGLAQLCQQQLGDSSSRSAEGIVKVLPGKLCRPHAKKMCKWGVDCNNIHVCRAHVDAVAGDGAAAPRGASSSGSAGAASSPSHAAAAAAGLAAHASFSGLGSALSASSSSGTPKSTPEDTPREANRALSGGVTLPQSTAQFFASPTGVLAGMQQQQQQQAPQMVGLGVQGSHQQPQFMPVSQQHAVQMAQQQQQMQVLAQLQAQQQQQAQAQQQAHAAMLFMQAGAGNVPQGMLQAGLPAAEGGIPMAMHSSGVPTPPQTPSAVHQVVPQQLQHQQMQQLQAGQPGVSAVAVAVAAVSAPSAQARRRSPDSPVDSILNSFQLLQLPKGGDNGF